jgi:multidrug transporter EmrE-like cation transporter
MSQAMNGVVNQAMNWSAFVLILAGVVLNAIAQLALKASVTGLGEIGVDASSLWTSAGSLVANVWLWVGLVCYGFSLIIWVVALSRVEVSVAYPMLSMGYIINAVAAWHLFGESLGAGKLTGIGIIIIGVYVLARS